MRCVLDSDGLVRTDTSGLRTGGGCARGSDRRQGLGYAPPPMRTGLAIAVAVALGAPARAESPRSVGWLEPVVFPDTGLRLVAKLDTGAKTSALDAEDVTPFSKDGEAWV